MKPTRICLISSSQNSLEDCENICDIFDHQVFISLINALLTSHQSRAMTARSSIKEVIPSASNQLVLWCGCFIVFLQSVYWYIAHKIGGTILWAVTLFNMRKSIALALEILLRCSKPLHSHWFFGIGLILLDRKNFPLLWTFCMEVDPDMVYLNLAF